MYVLELQMVLQVLLKAMSERFKNNLIGLTEGSHWNK